MSKKLNLGCGRDYRKGWENWDISGEVKVDRRIDIRSDNFDTVEAFTEIYCSGVLEQIAANEELVHVMNQCWDSLERSGSLTIVVPSAKFSTAFKDPFDVRQFTEATFPYFIKDMQQYRDYGSVYGFLPWLMQSIFTNEHGIITAVLLKP